MLIDEKIWIDFWKKIFLYFIQHNISYLQTYQICFISKNQSFKNKWSCVVDIVHLNPTAWSPFPIFHCLKRCLGNLVSLAWNDWICPRFRDRWTGTLEMQLCTSEEEKLATHKTTTTRWATWAQWLLKKIISLHYFNNDNNLNRLLTYSSVCTALLASKGAFLLLIVACITP